MNRLLAAIVCLGFAVAAVPLANRFEGDECPLADGTNGTCRDHAACPYLKTIPKKDWVTCSFHRPTGSRDSPIICCREDRKTPSKTPLASSRVSTRPQECESSGLVNHILGGRNATHEEFPYIAALGYTYDVDAENIFRCGASLIARDFLLTAAHCLSPERPKFARLGVADLFEKDPMDPPVNVDIVEWIPHPNYTTRPLVNDIALLRLKRELNEPFLKLACLYTKPTDPTPSESLKIAGWGATDPNDPSTSRFLQYANVTSYDRGECNATLVSDKTPRKKLLRLGVDQVCALGRNAEGDTVSDSCVGDSGGPLELTEGRRRIIVGVTSSGKLCGSKWPGIYTRVSNFVDWIDSIVWPNAAATTSG